MQGFDKFNYFLVEKQLWNYVIKQVNLQVVKIIIKKKTKKNKKLKLRPGFKWKNIKLLFEELILKI